ncbi:MAG: 5-formyltetrahydrofolate cyclo-ligase [Deltaproteobacteria bacterium]|nr:5-formyltetrahydrofolate cyclo-ligase [Deltaproteobacteria bacterium]
MLAALRAISPESRAEFATSACARVVALPEFSAAPRVAVYAALPSELSVTAVASAAAAQGKELLWPRLTPDGVLELAAARGDELVPSDRGFLAAPADRAPARLLPADLLLVPGVAFTRTGARLGRGGGHYDQLIAEAPGTVTVGVAFDIQLVREVPLEPHDRPVDLVITPSGVWRTK